MSRRPRLLLPALTGALLLPLAASAQDQRTGALVKDAPVRAGAAKTYATLGTLPKGERVTVISTSGEFMRISVRAFALARYFDLAADRKSATTSELAVVWANPSRIQARLPKGTQVEVAGVYFDWMVQLPLYVPKSAVRLDASPRDALAGTWTVSGRHTKLGSYQGTVTARLAGDAEVRLVAALKLAGDKELSWTGTGTLVGDKLSVDVSYKTPGAAGALAGETSGKAKGTYTVGEDVGGGWTSTSDAGLSVSERWVRTGDAPTEPDTPDTPDTPDQPDPPAAQAKATITAPKQALGVPGTPQAGHQPVTIKVEGGQVTLTLAGPGRLLNKAGDAPALVEGATLTLQPGEHTYTLEPGKTDGKLTLTAKAGDAEVGTSETAVTVERIYLFVFGYQGTETHYLKGDIGKVRSNVIKRIEKKGYTTIEDGESYDQKKIDERINDPKTPRKVVLDWATSRVELFKYLNRGTVRGLIWGSHGYMEPFLGCPDEELDRLESRVWSCPPGNPRTTDERNFVREWQAALAKSVATHKQLDFVVMHSCCTGGLGTYYWDEPWDYVHATTKARAKAKLGDPLPKSEDLRFRPFDGDLKPQTKFLQTYDGPSYFGFSDVSWYRLRRSFDLGR